MASIQIGQIVVREKGQRTCAHHRGQLLILYCETCDDVMCVKCITSIHKSHTVCDLSEVIPAKKTELQNHLDKNNRAQIKQDVDFTEIEMKKNLSNFDSLCRDVKAQSIKLKQAIDTKTEQVLSVCKEMEEGNIKALTNFRRELQSRLEYFDDDFQAKCAAVLRDGSDLQVHDTLEEVRAKAKVPLIPILGTASFSPNTNPHSFMDRYFGTLTTSAHRPPLQYKLLPKAIEQSSFEIKGDIYIQAIATTSASEVWVCYRTNIELLDVNGVVQQTIPWELPIEDACVSPKTQNLWGLYRGRCL
ncbi:uncharacterized protein [Argopecten irradians]|uniref:uncharacterized protein n=1 Tax=Argopecten irradians TaxID=31199 RepID=UPI003723ED21